MEAPEKLYVDTEDKLSDSILYGFTEKRKEDDIEYVRKNVFIEKACEWLENNLQGIVMGSIYIEDFRKYMNGDKMILNIIKDK